MLTRDQRKYVFPSCEVSISVETSHNYVKYCFCSITLSDESSVWLNEGRTLEVWQLHGLIGNLGYICVWKRKGGLSFKFYKLLASAQKVLLARLKCLPTLWVFGLSWEWKEKVTSHIYLDDFLFHQEQSRQDYNCGLWWALFLPSCWMLSIVLLYRIVFKKYHFHHSLGSFSLKNLLNVVRWWFPFLVSLINLVFHNKIAWMKKSFTQQTERRKTTTVKMYIPVPNA